MKTDALATEFRTETDFMKALTRASRAGEPLVGTFKGDVEFVYVFLQASENTSVTLDGEFTTRELAAIVGYKNSTL